MCLTLNLLLKRKGCFGDEIAGWKERVRYEPRLWQGLGILYERCKCQQLGPSGSYTQNVNTIGIALMVLTRTNGDQELEAIHKVSGRLGGVPLQRWVQTLKKETHLCIQENVQEMLSNGALSPTGYDLVMKTKPTIPQAIILEGRSTGNPTGSDYPDQPGYLP